LLLESETLDAHKLTARTVVARTWGSRGSRGPDSTSWASTRPMPVLRIKGLFHSFRDVLLEVVDLGFLGAESAPFPGPRVGAFLGSFTDGPILAVGVEVPIALDRRVRRTAGPESVEPELVRV